MKNDAQPLKTKEDEAKGKTDKEEWPDWWKEMQKHPFFADEAPTPDQMTPEWEALQSLKYDDEEPEDLANIYKNDGNYDFKFKQYHSAIDHYAEAIKQKCGNNELNAILYCNRATCHWHLKNYRSSFRDCLFSRKFKRDHMKAIVKGAQCLNELKMPGEAMKWCDEGLQLDPTHKQLLELREKAEQLKKTVERDRRKEEIKERKREKEENDLVKALMDRELKFEEFGQISTLKLHKLEPSHPGGRRVALDADGVLHWPVMFVYPEFSDTDFIQAFNENSCFGDHIEAMFGPESCPPPWDQNRLYTPESVQIYFENKEEKTLYSVDLGSTLKEILQNKKCIVAAGTPSFCVVRKDSRFAAEFRDKYS